MEEVIETNQICWVIQYSFTVLGIIDAFVMHIILIFIPQNAKSRAVTHV